jgi:hypothetical protein
MQNASQSAMPPAANHAGLRNKAPVFVLGCPRSGTTYLYHALLSAGNFAIYRTESEVLHVLEPRFGDLSVAQNRQRLLEAWFNSRLFTLTGLQRDQVETRVMSECRNGGDFLRIVMEETARHQGVDRWAECTPDHILYLDRIRQTIPDALVIHIIRDGRDVALSMERQGYPRQLPWDRSPRRMAAGLYWEWMVREGRDGGSRLGSNYMEVHFEDLIGNPREALTQVGKFIAQELDFDEIRRVGIGSVSKPNTSFQEESKNSSFSPIGRWRKFYSNQELSQFEALIGNSLREVNYQMESMDHLPSLRLNVMRAQYHAFFRAKFYARTRTPLGRLFVTKDLSWI